MALAIFDLDNTLIAGDSDYLWGEFAVSAGLVDEADYRAKNKWFMEQYDQGILDINDWLNFQLTVLSRYTMNELDRYRHKFVDTYIKPLVLPKAQEAIRHHRDQGDTLMILSATNQFITRPIANLFKINTLLATKPEIRRNRYTGKTTGIITFQAGKITALDAWLKAHHEHEIKGSYFYSDSHNDIPLLDVVDHPICVDPDDVLKAHANNNGWRICSFRHSDYVS